MDRRRVLLVSQPDLLGESLEHILNSLEEVQVIVTWQPGEQVIADCSQYAPDLVILTENEQSVESGNQLTTRLLDSFPNLIVIRINQDSDLIHAYTSQTIPARVADLADAIRRLPLAVMHKPTDRHTTGR